MFEVCGGENLSGFILESLLRRNFLFYYADSCLEIILAVVALGVSEVLKLI